MQEFKGSPLARSQGLVIEELNDELLVYDLEADRAHSLSPAAARVWQRCDGETAIGGLSAELDLDAETVSRALEELTTCGLLETATSGTTAASGTTRREMGVRVAKVGAAVATAPLIISVVAPTPAMAVTLQQCLAQTTEAGNCGNECHQIGCCCCNGNFVGKDSNFKWCVDTQASCTAIPGGKTCA